MGLFCIDHGFEPTSAALGKGIRPSRIEIAALFDDTVLASGSYIDEKALLKCLPIRTLV